MCDSPSLFILSVLCVVVSISGRLYFCIFSCDPLLFLSAVLCPSPQAIGGFAISPCCLVGWSEAYKLFVFWRSQDGILFIVLCVLLLCCAVSGAVLCCLLWKCVKYQDIGETYPRVVYILRKSAYVGRGRMCSIFMIRVKFECSERLLLLYHFSIYGYTASHITLVII